MNLAILITLAILATIAVFLWAIHQRGGKRYFLAISYTCALIPIVCFTLFLSRIEIENFAEFFEFIPKGIVFVSFFTYPIALVFTIVFFSIACLLGATNIPNENRITKPTPLKWFCYVLLNGVVVNSILCITFESKDILCYITSTTLIILQYPILCKMDNWTKKSFILTATMMIFFFLFYFISTKEDIDKTILDHIGSVTLMSILGFTNGSIFLMAIIWMNYALRKRLF